jgi:hypothetical protein
LLLALLTFPDAPAVPDVLRGRFCSACASPTTARAPKLHRSSGRYDASPKPC